MADPEDQDTESNGLRQAAETTETETTDHPAPEPTGKRGGLAGRLLLSTVAILTLLGAAGYGALVFREKDERIDAAATIVEAGAEEARTIWESARGRFAGLTGEKPDEPATASPEALPAVADPSTGAAAETTPGEKPPESTGVGALAETETKTPESAQDGSGPETGRAAEKAPEPEKAPVNETATENPPGASEISRPAATGGDLAALTAKLDETAELARRALAAAERGGEHAAGAMRGAAHKDELTALDLANALEGRIDAIGDELKTLRERLDSPKNETRAEPVAGGSANEAATVVVAFALQKELAAGHPFLDEIAALQRTGADAAILATLEPMARTGAPTGAALLALFRPFEKKIRAEERAAGQDLAAHILHGASKLVRVRPTGEAQPDTPDGYLARIDAALMHDDFGAAAAAFEALPEADRAQAGEFAELLRKRAAADKAAYELLHGAIAALGGVRK